MNRPLCFSSLGCPEDSLQSLCETAHSHGIAAVEVRSLAGQMDYPSFLATHPEELESAKRVLEQSGVRMALLASSFCLTQHSANDLPGLLAVCRVADRLASPYVRVFGGGSEGRFLADAEIRSAALLYRDAVDFCEGNGVRCRLLVETHGSLVNTPSLRALSEIAEREVLFLWDTHHTWKLGGEPPAQTFAAIGSRVRHMHLKDSVCRDAKTNAYGYVLPGTGEFPFRELFDTTRSQSREITFSLEWERKWHPELEPLEMALEAFKKVLASE